MKLLQTVFFLSALTPSLVAAQVLDVPFQDDVPTRTLLIPASKARAVVLLFPGGGGFLRLKDDGSTNNFHTFVRSKDLWAPYGIDAVLVDTPYDLGAGSRNLRSIRNHQQRLSSVVRYYQEKLKLPIWIFGHSMGTVSVTEFVNGGKDQAGMVAGVIVAGTYRTASIDSDVQAPVLAIHHLQDGCANTPLSTSEGIIKSRPGTSVAQFISMDGGISEGDVCGSKAYHGFNEKEPEFVKTAAQFILKN
ncbi:alpha/beta fold hydrolase [Polynucleobacter sinensis]|jgi:pimeloyl-ACP methyl ester carboxylesterase|uniref:alpha/beta hydrolase n=1 Tax=Polynucleobacter sinensis TaxID=1743157 RepID=UPI000782F074|nr:alpha/beta hydrolase [Polynucleobacter sinensis]